MSEAPSTPRIVDVTGGDTRRAAAIGNLLDDGRRSRDLRRVLLAIAALVLLFLLWSVLAQVDEIAKARGEVQPVARMQTIQTRYGGTMSELLVREDDRVTAGQVIARFTTTDADRDKAKAEVRRASLQIDLERWGAIADDRPAGFGAFAEYPKLVAETQALHENQITLNAALVRAKANALAEQQQALAGVRNELPSARNELAAAREVMHRDQEGVEKGVLPKAQLAEAKEHFAATERNVTQLQSRVAELEKAVSVAEAELEQVRDQIVQEARGKRAEILEQIAELDAEIKALNTYQDRREVTAPVNGIIKQLAHHGGGAVLNSGDVIAELVPTDGGVFIEAKVTARDIGFVKAGQRALVKIDTYDYSRFGSVEGTVIAISPTAFQNEKTGEPYYKVQVEPAQEFVGSDADHRLTPGMTAEVDIATGRKSVFQYLVKPVFVGADTAFHER